MHARQMFTVKSGAFFSFSIDRMAHTMLWIVCVFIFHSTILFIVTQFVLGAFVQTECIKHSNWARKKNCREIIEILEYQTDSGLSKCLPWAFLCFDMRSMLIRDICLWDRDVPIVADERRKKHGFSLKISIGSLMKCDRSMQYADRCSDCGNELRLRLSSIGQSICAESYKILFNLHCLHFDGVADAWKTVCMQCYYVHAGGCVFKHWPVVTYSGS